MTLVGIIVLLFGCLVALAGFLNIPRGFHFLLLFMVGCLIAYFGIRLASRNQEKLKKYQEELSELDEFKNAKYKHIFQDTAIAIHPDREKLFLANGPSIKMYDFYDVREWGFNIQSGLSNPNNLKQSLEVIGESIENARNTNFFVHVRDVENPTWIIRFSALDDKEKEMRKWKEILTQYINERA